jgi:hypothetical protein
MDKKPPSTIETPPISVSRFPKVTSKFAVRTKQTDHLNRAGEGGSGESEGDGEGPGQGPGNETPPTS